MARRRSVGHEVLFSPEAEQDILALYEYVSANSGPARAHRYATRIVAYCRGFSLFPERGLRRDDIRPGLRVIGFERRVNIAFHIAGDAITIDRILYGGRDLGLAFGIDEPPA